MAIGRFVDIASGKLPALPGIYRSGVEHSPGFSRHTAGLQPSGAIVRAETIAMTIGRSLMIFDVEGTLVDSTGLTLRCWQETLQSFGFEIPLLRQVLSGPHVTRALASIIDAQGRRYRQKYLPQVTAFLTCGRCSNVGSARAGLSPWPRAHPPMSSTITSRCSRLEISSMPSPAAMTSNTTSPAPVSLESPFSVREM